VSKRAEQAEEVKPYVSVKCECGKTHGNYLGHYDRLRASCGRIFWVLQPLRNGPFVLKLWPGLNLSRAEMAEKYGTEEES